MGGEPFVPTFCAHCRWRREALSFAERAHGGQRRGPDQAAFVLHPIEVAALLHVTGHAEAVVAAGILHERIEATGTGPEEIRARFGDAIGDVVEALTEDASIVVVEERKAALRRQVSDFDGDAIAVAAADKVTKVRELRARASSSRQVLNEVDTQRTLAHNHLSCWPESRPGRTAWRARTSAQLLMRWWLKAGLSR